jgi:CheY-like chemotaxis protein
VTGSAQLILLVNNIPDHASAYKAVLAAYGYSVRLATSGEEALRLVREVTPECVVIDLRLPDMSGWELCRVLKARAECATIRIVVLTPDVSRTAASDSTQIGCNAWLTRPTAAEDLARTVRRVLNTQTAEPSSEEEARLGLTECPACASDRIRATLRVGSIQYYCCLRCSFCWRVETLAAASS